MTLDEHLALARQKVIQEQPHPQQPDWSLDQDVQRYSREVGRIHTLMEEAERAAALIFIQTLSIETAPRRNKRTNK